MSRDQKSISTQMWRTCFRWQLSRASHVMDHCTFTNWKLSSDPFVFKSPLWKLVSKHSYTKRWFRSYTIWFHLQ